MAILAEAWGMGRSGIGQQRPGRWRAAGFGFLIDRLLPPGCYLCDELIGPEGLLCATCWAELTFLSAPQCRCCGMPFELDVGEAVCARCLRHPQAFDQARAALLYDDASRPLLLRFKHGDRTEAARTYGAWLARPAAALRAQGAADDPSLPTPLVLPVPLHWRRLLKRRYNQSALIGQAVARRLDLPYRPALLQRRRATASQGHLSRDQRQRNLRGAFRVPARHKPALRGAWIFLIDDVLTSGATANACARALKRAGARRVDLITLARVER
jgi:ComF family protein